MDFYLNPRNETLTMGSAAHLLLRAIDLNVALYLNAESLQSIDPDVNPEHSYTNVRALKEIDAVVGNVQSLGATVLKGMDIDEWSSKSVRLSHFRSLYVLTRSLGLCRSSAKDSILREPFTQSPGKHTFRLFRCPGNF